MKITRYITLLLSLTTLWLSASAVAKDQVINDTSSITALATVKPIVSCNELMNMDLSGIGGKGSQITDSRETQVNGYQVCAVSGTLAPSIGFKVLLPIKTWTQRFLQVGCGGLCGRIGLDSGAAAECMPLNTNQFVVSSTNMGHDGMSGDFGNDKQKRADFAYRSVHLTSVVTKAIIGRFYGQAPRYAYFNGCSDGGREALMEAQRYPKDFNGIIAGAPAMNFLTQNALYHAWQAVSNTDADGKAILLASRLPLIHQAVLAQCDAQDGQKDGLIADPRNCHFDPASLQCSAAQEKNPVNCLTSAEVNVVRRFYQGPRDPQTGENLIAGGPLPGSELAWTGIYVPEKTTQPLFSQMIALQALQYVVFQQNPAAGFALKDVLFNKATFDKLAQLHSFYDATNPDLSAFYQAGGKLIIWQGWADPHISPLNTIAYHQAVEKQMGQGVAGKFERLYLLPGVYHCSGGEGNSLVDMLTPMLNWVERATAPQSIITYQADNMAKTRFGQPDVVSHDKLAVSMLLQHIPAGAASRPVYPFPAIAVYSGKGDVDKASSYKPVISSAANQPVKWLGEDFYRPYPPMQ
jgi:hypothetical protein